MGFEARYQAMPEGEFLERARVEIEFAESLQFIHDAGWRTRGTELWRVAVRKLVEQHPGLPDRYFYAGSRNFDAIHYLLSDGRRRPTGQISDDPALIAKAIRGMERLNSKASTTQGFPIGLVRSDAVPQVASYLAGITQDDLRQHFDHEKMLQAAVYKCPSLDAFAWVWEELQGMRTVYEAAARHGEAIVNLID
jgi:Domain of unknown function (DUF1877)